MDPRAIKNTISVSFEDGIIAMIDEATLLEQNDFCSPSWYFVCWSWAKSSMDIDDSIVSHFCTLPSDFKENPSKLIIANSPFFAWIEFLRSFKFLGSLKLALRQMAKKLHCWLDILEVHSWVEGLSCRKNQNLWISVLKI